MHADRSVMLVSFDVPYETKQNRREYRVFHKYLKQSGYIMLQQSLYVKIVSAASNESAFRELREKAPQSGNVLALPLTLNQFNKIVSLTGNHIDFELLTEEIMCF